MQVILTQEGPWEGRQDERRAEQHGGVTLLQLPCLLGIRYLPTHPEPLVHPKYTPAEKVTLETMVGSGSLPHSQTHWQGTALLRLFPEIDLTSSNLVTVKDRPLGDQ